ncbi:LPXTG-domain-containing protein [Purpureocillium lilacinum]|uniref:LPXTG-domain-containing protein n=1 Tax=Purpureocillium lilacinum TaxID=33203 RepID=A0A179GK23_PURLI|nr:LPXTG-domain-containing protein [Purpureocillium lilacinum]
MARLASLTRAALVVVVLPSWLLAAAAAAAATGLLVSPGSPCVELCANDTALGRNASTTTVPRRQDIPCEDRQMGNGGGGNKQLEREQQQQAVGAQFRQCVACLEKSAFEQAGESDQQWFVYNMRYAIDFCIFGYPNGTGGAGSNPCLTSEACGRLARALEGGIPVGDRARASTDTYSYCEAERGVWKSRYFDACVQCVKADGRHRYLTNFLIALDAACKQKPSRGLVLGLNDTVFANTTVSPAQPSPPTSPRRPSPAAPDGNDGALLSGGAIAGIVVGVLALVTLAAGCVFVCCRRRRKNRRIKKLATPSPPPSSSSPLPLQRHSPAPAAGPSGREEGVMAGTAAQASGAVGGEHGEEVDYDGRFFGNDKTKRVAQATFSPVANSKPIAIWPARPAPDPPQGHGKGTPLPSIETEPLPVDASPDGAVSAVSTFSNVPLLSNPPYKPTGSPAVGSSPIFATGRKSPVPKGQSGLPRSVQQHHDHQQLQQQWQQQQGQGKRKKKKRRDSSVSSPYETTKIQTEFAPPPKG